MRIRWVASVVAVLVLAGCGSSGGGGSSLSAKDRAACDKLNLVTQPSPDVQALNQAFGLNGQYADGLSQKLAPYAQLVGASAQLVLSGADDRKLGGYVGQMRGVCETLGWRA